jgi:protein subunit release factor A
MRKFSMVTFFLLFWVALPLQAKTLLEEFQSDPNVVQALNQLNTALSNPSLQEPLSTLNELSSNPKALEAIQGLQDVQSLDQLGAALQDPFVQQYAQAMEAILNDPGVIKAFQKFQAAVQANPQLASILQDLQDPNAMQQLLNELATQAKRSQQTANTLKLLLQPAF